MRLIIRNIQIFSTILITCSSLQSLMAETGFSEGRYFLELRGFRSGESTGQLDKNVEERYDNRGQDFPAWHALVANSTKTQKDQQELNEALFYRGALAKRPRLRSSGVDLLVEYAVSKHFGWGFSIRNENYRMTNYRPLRSIGNDLYFGLLASMVLNTSIPDIGNYVLISEKYEPLFLGTRDLAETNNLNIHTSWHFLANHTWDPYLRSSLGFGKETRAASDVARVGLALGLRYFASKRYYIVSEVEFSNSVFRVSPLYPETRSDNRTNLSQWSTYLGIGLGW